MIRRGGGTRIFDGHVSPGLISILDHTLSSRSDSPESPDTPLRPAPARPPRGRVKTFSSLQNHINYRYLWTGNLFANCAQWLQFITIGWLALDITGSALHSILTVAVRALPVLILGPWGGVLADRWDRRPLVMGIQVVMVSSALAFGVLLAKGMIDSISHVRGRVTSVWHLREWADSPVRRYHRRGGCIGGHRSGNGHWRRHRGDHKSGVTRPVRQHPPAGLGLRSIHECCRLTKGSDFRLGLWRLSSATRNWLLPRTKLPPRKS